MVESDKFEPCYILTKRDASELQDRAVFTWVSQNQNQTNYFISIRLLSQSQTVVQVKAKPN